MENSIDHRLYLHDIVYDELVGIQRIRNSGKNGYLCLKSFPFCLAKIDFATLGCTWLYSFRYDFVSFAHYKGWNSLFSLSEQDIN
jgi:hypothetical protein